MLYTPTEAGLFGDDDDDNDDWNGDFDELGVVENETLVENCK